MSSEKDSPNYFSRIDTSRKFEITSDYQPQGDQPKAIDSLVKFVNQGSRKQVLLGATGTGKTFTVANVIEQIQRPALVLAHNKTLAAQLYSEFTELFQNNAVRYFVSYYDYYQPEAYVPSSDTYIEKDATINEEIDKLRHATTKALLERRDTIVVASVSCIYGLGEPESYFDLMLYVEKGDKTGRQAIVRKLIELQYERNDIEFKTGSFRVRGDIVEICPASESERSIRIEFFGDEIEEISEIDRITQKVLTRLGSATIYPASHYATTKEVIDRACRSIKKELGERLEELNKENKVLEAHRLEQRTLYDLEMLQEVGFCPGIENYSRHLTGKNEGEAPPTLIDYFPPDFCLFVDESHVTIPQVVGMFRGDRARKQTLVDYGFRLPSALDNRPLKFEEFDQIISQAVYVSATPAKFELEESENKIVEQIIRPTGLLDPQVIIKPAGSQVDDFLAELNKVVEKGERALVTTLTKKMAENLSDYYREIGVRVKYLHSDIDTLERIELIRGLRDGLFDVLVGINLLREGLDLPEVSLIGIMDADKEGFLRSETSLIQTIGRAARNVNGRVILYADKETKSIKRAIEETNRRREIQEKYNKENNITPRTVKRAPEAKMVEREELFVNQEIQDGLELGEGGIPNTPKECRELLDKLRKQMYAAAKELEFEKAAIIRDQISEVEKYFLTL